MIEVTEEMREVIKSDVYLNVTESTGRVNITIGGDFHGICQSIIEMCEVIKPTRKPLSEHEVNNIVFNLSKGSTLFDFTRLVEQAHGIH